MSKGDKKNKNKSEKAASVVAPATREEWMVAQLKELQNDVFAVQAANPKTKEFVKVLAPVINKYAFMSADFEGVRAVIGYKRVVKVAFLGKTPAEAAKGRG